MRLKILSKWPLFIINLAGIILSLMIIFFPIFNPFGQDSYTKADSPANNQIPQNLVDDKSAEFVQSSILQEQVHLPINKQVERDLVDAKPVEPTQKIASSESVNPPVKVNSQPSRNPIDGKPVELAQSVILLKSESMPVDQPDSGTPASSASPEPRQGGPELGRSGLADRPIRLKIPKINVDAIVEYVGLTSQGAMDIPKGPSGVAWFKLGARPGDNGSAVMAGHYGRWKNGQGSVFDDLNKLSEGDKLYVKDEKGAIITFIVRESRKYDPKADARDIFDSNDGGSHLNLIACDGVWDKAAKSYSKRLIVFADKE